MDVQAEPTNSLREFVRTPFAVRCNVVKFWRPLPVDLWEGLGSPSEVVRSKAREQRAVVAVLLMAVGVTAMSLAGLYGITGQSPWLVLWTVLPPLFGWGFVRLWWIPQNVTDAPERDAALAFARCLSGVYLYVYLMILAGAGLSALLGELGPEKSRFLRFCLWYFLFGESFFVPAATWLRLVANDPAGRIFGRSRWTVLTAYMIFFVLLPVAGLLAGVCVKRL